MRKTIEVKKVLDMVNSYLENPNLNIEEKKGFITFIEKLLMDCGQYNGFVYLGLVDDGKGNLVPVDEYQRKYFMKKS